MSSDYQPIYYPPADHAVQWFHDTHPGARVLFNRRVLWHTTEGGSGWPSYVYNGVEGGSAPHLTCRPNRTTKTLDWRQHYRLDESACALRNLAGGVETNRTGVIQIELVGTSVPGDPGYPWHAADDWALEGLALFSRWLSDTWDIPLTDQGRRWVPIVRRGAYVFQVGAPSRLSPSAWLAAYGHLGHQHAAENDHIDPGALDVPRMLTMARGEDDMPTPEEVAAAVWAHKIGNPYTGGESPAGALVGQADYYSISGGLDGKFPAGAASDPGGPTVARKTLEKLDALAAAVAELRATIVPPTQ